MFFKSYLHQKTIFCHIEAINEHVIIFLNLKKKMIFRASDQPKSVKISDVNIDITATLSIISLKS